MSASRKVDLVVAVGRVLIPHEGGLWQAVVDDEGILSVSGRNSSSDEAIANALKLASEQRMARHLRVTQPEDTATPNDGAP